MSHYLRNVILNIIFKRLLKQTSNSRILFYILNVLIHMIYVTLIQHYILIILYT